MPRKPPPDMTIETIPLRLPRALREHIESVAGVSRNRFIVEAAAMAAGKPELAGEVRGRGRPRKPRLDTTDTAKK